MDGEGEIAAVAPTLHHSASEVRPMRFRTGFAALIALFVGGAAANVSGQGRRVVLDVPYLTESEDSCGGAAAAMVFRYWGARDVAAGDLKACLDSGNNGVHTSSLMKAVAARGWRATSIPTQPGNGNGRPASGNVDDLAREVELGRPPIALIEVAPGIRHYVVILAVTGRDVVLHDPASRPFETMSLQSFSAAWNASGAWVLVVLPATEPVSKPRHRTIEATIPADLPIEARCATLIAQAVANSKAGDLAGSERNLVEASSRCPESAAGWRELAGLRFVNSRWEEARALASKAVELSPKDERSWQILGASLFLQGDALGALRAWNRVGDPRVEAVVVSGANRTRHSVIVDRIGLKPRDLLTPSAFRRAARRAADLPAATTASVRYFPHDDAGASVDVNVHEGRVFPWGAAALGNIAGRALILDEVKLPFAGPTGNGERIDVEYGWKRNRPRAAVRLTAPAPGVLPGLIVLEVARSRQTFDAAGAFGAGRIVEDRRGVRVGLEDWATGRIHWNVEGAFTRLAQGSFAALGGGLDTRLFDDRVALLADVAMWRPTAGGEGFDLGSVAAKWRQHVVPEAGGWSAEAGASFSSAAAPLSFWSGADVGASREAFLRGHKLLTEGIVTSDVFGRHLSFASVTYERPVRTFKFGTATIAAFVDAARASRGMVTDRAVAHVDAGLGVRLHSSQFGSIRVDLGYGLRDSSTAVSAGFMRTWPRR